jgi:hypothetical protein
LLKEETESMIARLRHLTALTALTLLAIPGILSAAEVDKYLPNETDSVCMINVRQILHSPVAKRFALNKQLAALLKFHQGPEVLNALGLDLLKDVHKVVLAGWGEGEDWGFLLIMHGQYDTVKLPASFNVLAKAWPDKMKERKEGDHRFWEIVTSEETKKDGEKAADQRDSVAFGFGISSDSGPRLLPKIELNAPLFFALVDKSTIVLSPQKDRVRAAFQRAADGKRPKLAKDMRDSILEQDLRQSIWFSMRMSPIKPPKNDDSKEAPSPSDPDDLVFFEGGFVVDAGVKIHATVTTRNAEAARGAMRDLDDIRTRLEGLVALLAGSKKDRSSLTGIVRSFKTTRKGRVVTLDAQIPVDVFDDLEDMLAPAPENASRPAAAPPPPMPRDTSTEVPPSPPIRDVTPPVPAPEPKLPVMGKAGTH